MSQSDLRLRLQSSHDAVLEAIADLREALSQTEALEDDGDPTLIPSGELERVIAQCQSVQRKLDQWQARM